jgi:uncharacterized phage-associated protein
MASVFDVAKYILSRKGSVSTWKLQKLVYYSQAWSLVWDEKPLFNEEIYAWANGPVCKELYDYHRGLFSLSENTFGKGSISKLTKSQKDTIDAVLKSYGKYTGQQLSNLTHSEEPWRAARKGLEVGERGHNKIELDCIAEFYSALYAVQTE